MQPGTPSSYYSADHSRLIDQDGYVDYVPAFLETQEADDAFERALRTIEWRQEHIFLFGKRYEVPRLSAWFSQDGQSYTYSNISHKAQEIPPFLDRVRQRIEIATGFRFNSVLANLYENGTHSVGLHADNEPELGSQVNIGSFSLGATRTLRFRHRTQKALRFSQTLDHNSLVIMGAPLQRFWLHELPKSTKVLNPRINFSFRYTSTQSEV